MIHVMMFQFPKMYLFRLLQITKFVFDICSIHYKGRIIGDAFFLPRLMADDRSLFEPMKDHGIKYLSIEGLN